MLTSYPDETAGAGPAVWIDLLSPSDDEISRASAACGVAIPSRQQLEEIESSSRLRAEGDSLILSMPIASKSQAGDTLPTPLGFVLTKNVLVTVRYAELHAIPSTIENMRKEAAPSSVDAFATLVEAMVDYAADALEEIAAELNAVSRRVFGGRTPQRSDAQSSRALKEILTKVGEAGDRLSHIRDSLLGLQRIAPYASDKGQKWMSETVQGRLRTVSQDLQSLADFQVHLTDKVQFLLDAALGFINTEQNDIFRVLTIVSVVGIPPTLIASMYGMNFDTIREYHWQHGYAWGLFLIVVSAAVPIAWFKWRGWW